MEKKLYEALEGFREAISTMVETMKNLISNTVEAIETIEREQSHRASWYVPKQIVRNHQVLNRKPMLANVRSSI